MTPLLSVGLHKVFIPSLPTFTMQWNKYDHLKSTLHLLTNNTICNQVTPLPIYQVRESDWSNLIRRLPLDHLLNYIREWVQLTSLMRKWSTCQKQGLISPLDCSPIVPKSLRDNKNYLAYSHAISHTISRADVLDHNLDIGTWLHPESPREL